VLAREPGSTRSPRWLRWALSALTLLVMSCTKPIVARAPLFYPAAVPIRVFPEIVIAGGKLPEGDLGAQLAEHLKKDGQHVVKQVEVAELEPLRAAGGLSAFSLVVLLEVGFFSDQQDGVQTVPVSGCDYFFGCYTQYQAMYTSVPELGAEAKLTIYEGPSARTLQVATLDASLEGEDSPAGRKEVLRLLGKKLQRAVDVLQSETRVMLEPVDDHPIVRDALRRIQKGEWDEGRALLEQAADGLGGLKHKVQARIWYDLALTRWYAPGPDGLTEPAYEAAKRALVLAMQLEGRGRYEPALASLARARERAKLLEEQRSAARNNYALRSALVPGEAARAADSAVKAETPAPP
jgi:hypothetical protein